MALILGCEKPPRRHIDTSHWTGREKRIKLDHESSSAPSNASADSELMPTSVPDESTDASDIESNASSELSESSEEPSNESSDEDSDISESEDELQEQEVVNLRANRGKKPIMKLQDYKLGEDIRPFLKDFLPKLKAANEVLEAQKQAGTLKTAELEEEGGTEGDGKEQYIEMNLGLGVLETKTADASDSSDSESEDEDGQPQEKDIMGKLMGRDRTRAAASVQEVDEERNNT